MKKPLVTYSPPKSSHWGHRVGRHRATDLMDLAFRFLDEKCNISSASVPTCMLFLATGNSADANSEMLEAAKRVIVDGAADVQMYLPGASCVKAVTPQPVERVREIAENFDSFVDAFPGVVTGAAISVGWMFAWKSELESVPPLAAAGGLFSVALGKPHVVTTMFNFRSLDDYFSIKEYLAAIGLCNLSDKHVKPKRLIEEWNQRPKP